MTNDQKPAKAQKAFLEGARTDESLPYGKQGRPLDSHTKSMWMGDDGTSQPTASRWAMSLGGEKDMMRPYAQHPWVYACVSAIARAAASVPLKLHRTGRDGHTETVTEDAVLDLLSRPNPLMSQRKFMRCMATNQQLYGESFLILLKEGHPVEMKTRGMSSPHALVEEPDEFWVVRGDIVDMQTDKETGVPRQYRIPVSGGYRHYPAHAVVQIADINPYSPLRGMGPAQAAHRTATLDFNAQRFDEALLANGGSPGGVLTTDGPLTDSDMRSIRQSWRETYNRAEGHKQTAVLPKGTTYKEIGMTPVDMEHQDLREWNRDTIMSVFGVTRPIIGLTEGLNYASARHAFRVFWEVTVIPYLDFLVDELNTKLVARIAGVDKSMRLGYDISGVSALREDADSKVDRMLKIYEQGHRSFREAAELAGMDLGEVELDGIDERYRPANLVEADEPTLDLSKSHDPEQVENLENYIAMVEEENSEMRMALEERGIDTEFSEQERLLEQRALQESEQKNGDLDEVFAKWRDTVNMSASDLKRWSDNECSRLASVDPDAVIKRNLRLLEKNKDDWNAKDITDANRAISFISRMRGMPKGDPVREGCESKRDISLKNWAYNPNKGSKSESGSAVTKISWPEGLKTEEKRISYWKVIDAEQQFHTDQVTRRIRRVSDDLVLATRQKLREVARQERKAPAVETKLILTRAEIERILDLNEERWLAELEEAVRGPLEGVINAAAASMSAEIGGGSMGILTVTDPIAVNYVDKSFLMIKEGWWTNAARSLQDTILQSLTGAPQNITQISEAIAATLETLEGELRVVQGQLRTRALMISRTEVGAAQNFARTEQMALEGIETHTWLASRDEVVRDAHNILDGTTVKVGDEFGYGLRWPGDKNATASQVINCRCFTAPGKN
jgi:HK97 family phage portal protein